MQLNRAPGTCCSEPECDKFSCRGCEYLGKCKADLQRYDYCPRPRACSSCGADCMKCALWDRMAEMAEQPEERVVLVTDDKWMRVKGGLLDPDDREVLREVGNNGRFKVVVMNLEESIREMQAQEPEKFDQFKKLQEKSRGKPLTIEEIVQLSIQADAKKTMYDVECRIWMTEDQAREVRRWRVEMHYTWRSVARAAYKRLGEQGRWPKWRYWHPASNQLMGMALCERAASMLGENYRQEPWN